jgi:predicted NUDIX family NTP pyrophosphohydrolase
VKKSAGILLYKIQEKTLFFFLVHYGGPFWAKKDEGAWTIPKGEFEEGEHALNAARREFREETGQELKATVFTELTPVRQKAGKVIYAWAAEGMVDETRIESNLTEIEWPPRSGRRIKIPEIDKGRWFTEEEAMIKINSAQRALLKETLSLLSEGKK